MTVSVFNTKFENFRDEMYRLGWAGSLDVLIPLFAIYMNVNKKGD